MAHNDGNKTFRMNIRLKILAGIGVVLLILLALGGTAVFNLNDIRAKFDGLVQATQVERYAYNTIGEEKNYLLEEKAESYASAMKDLDTIIVALDTIDKTSTDAELLKRSKEARAAALEYRKGYENGVAALKANKEAVKVMIADGQRVVDLALEYYQSTKKEAALWVYATALSIMKAEKEERINRNREFYKKMLDLRTTLNGYFTELDPVGKDDKVNQARKATEDYFKAAAAWIDNDTRLTREILPRMSTLGAEVVRLAYDAAGDAAKSMIATQNLSNSIIAIGIAIAVALGVVIAIILSGMITRPLIYGVSFAQNVAHGDLTQRIEPQYLQRSDEIGDLAHALDNMVVQLAELAGLTGRVAHGDLTIQLTHTGQEIGIYAAVRDMVTQLKGIVTQVTQATSQVSSAAHEIAQGSADLSQRTEEQASALEETASSMEQLTSTVKQSADNAGQANQLALAARHQAEQGGQVVDQAITAMSAINQSSRKIADIISVIDEIAFQTNLLALNAAVEAARAGEQGRGFAVVAGEVRKLAQRSADAAKEIKGLISDSVSKVEDGGKLVGQSGQTLKEIVGAVKKVSDIVAEIASAAREQAGGIEQVNKAILQMDQVTQQNAALVEQTAAASHAMGDQALQLQTLMGFFTLPDQSHAESAFRPALPASVAVLDRQPPHRPGIAARKAPATPIRRPTAAPASAPQKVAAHRGNGGWHEADHAPVMAARSSADGEWEQF